MDSRYLGHRRSLHAVRYVAMITPVVVVRLSTRPESDGGAVREQPTAGAQHQRVDEQQCTRRPIRARAMTAPVRRCPTRRGRARRRFQAATDPAASPDSRVEFCHGDGSRERSDTTYFCALLSTGR